LDQRILQVCKQTSLLIKIYRLTVVYIKVYNNTNAQEIY
jgi:hypothetical protein